MKQPVKICLTALKGGAGKSTLTFQCATALAARGKRVLVIDVDPQSNTTLKMSELPINERYEHSVANIYNGDFTVRPQISNYENIDIIPASIYLQLTAEEIVSKPAREKIMYNYLKSSDWIAEYDYIFFDTAPAMNTINQNAFYCADHIFLVAEPDSFSVSGVILFSDKWSLVANALEIENNIKGVITNKVNTNLRKTGEYYKTMHELGYAILASIPYLPATIETEMHLHPQYKLEIDVLLEAIQGKETEQYER